MMKWMNSSFFIYYFKNLFFNDLFFEKMSGDGKKKTPASRKMNYRERQSINYQKGSDPPFLAQMKKQLGYREYTVEDKFADNEEEDAETDDPSQDRDDIRNMPEEDRPQIVVMDPGKDLSTAELQKEIDKKREEDDKRMILEGRIKFRKPEKRPMDAANEEEGATGSKMTTKKKNDEEGEKRRRRTEEQEEDKQKSQSAPTNRRLLSFGVDEED